MPSSASAPVAAIAAAVRHVAPELARDLEREGRPADGPPTRPRSMSTSNGSSILASWSMRIPTIARDGSSGLATVLTVTSNGLPLRRRVSSTLVAGRPLADLARGARSGVRKARRRGDDRRRPGRATCSRGRRRNAGDEDAAAAWRRRRSRARAARRPRRSPRTACMSAAFWRAALLVGLPGGCDGLLGTAASRPRAA